MLVSLSLVACVAASVASASYGGSRCYDCNYAPSGYHRRYNDVIYGDKLGYNAGTPQCALRHQGDSDALSDIQYKCKSGKCFVRMDKNGLVYRGCADAANLPGGVKTKEQCRYQGNSLWYFCEGDLCNNEQIGKTCGKPVYGPKYDICDGKCYGNPSGLYPDNYNKNGFIQCGCGNDAYGKTCTCCVPFRFKCPYGTTYNDYEKACVKKGYTKY